MTEKAPFCPEFLIINGELQSVIKSKKELKKELTDSLIKLFSKMSDVLKDYGEEKQRSEGTGAGGNLYGYRLTQVSYRETPPVEVKSSKGKSELVIAEDFTSEGNYSLSKDTIIVIASDVLPNGEKNRKRIFSVKSDGSKAEAKNWFYNPATKDDIIVMSGLIAFMKTSLSQMKSKAPAKQ